MQESVENILIHSLLRLCETKPLKKITLNELLKVSDVSRTAFNNRYLDLNDLIYQIWLQRIVVNSWNDLDESYENYYLSCLISFKRYIKYSNFFIQAYEMEGQNCLRDCINRFSIDFDQVHFHPYVSSGQITDTQARFIASFHSHGIHNALYLWLKEGAKTPVEQMARMCADARYSLLQACIYTNQKGA